MASDDDEQTLKDVINHWCQKFEDEIGEEIEEEFTKRGIPFINMI